MVMGLPRSAAMGSPSTLADILSAPAVKHAIAHPRRIDRSHDVPYLAGSNNAGGVTYIDKRVPKRLTLHGAGGRQVTIDPAVPLNVHEQVEHALMVRAKLPYETAHRIALKHEQKAVADLGANWTSYQDAMHRLAATTQAEHPANPPRDLYLKPYPHTEAEFLRHEAKAHHV